MFLNRVSCASSRSGSASTECPTPFGDPSVLEFKPRNLPLGPHRRSGIGDWAKLAAGPPTHLYGRVVPASGTRTARALRYVRVTTGFKRMLEVPGAHVRTVAFTPAGVVVRVRLRRKRLRCPCGQGAFRQGTALRSTDDDDADVS